MKLRNNYFEHLYHITKGIYFKVQKRQNSGKGQVKIRQEARDETRRKTFYGKQASDDKGDRTGVRSRCALFKEPGDRADPALQGTGYPSPRVDEEEYKGICRSLDLELFFI